MTSNVEDLLWRGLTSAFGALSDPGGRSLASAEVEDNVFHSGDTGHGINPSTPLDDGHGDDGDGGHSSFGVHITYEDLYSSIIFFTVIYIMGYIAQRFLKMPSLVGEIFAGILLGPNLADFVPNPQAFVMLGEIGLILLVLEAGIDIDLTTLKLIGARGIIIAFMGSVLPIGIAVAIAFAIGTDTKGAIAAGAAFGPTSLGIAMNILRQGKIVNTPVGQLVVSAAVIDDMIALVILSQLGALTGDTSVVDIVAPIVSALGFLILGGYVAVYVLPTLIDRFVLSKVSEERQGAVSMTIMLCLVLGLMPATYYARASFLMGVFVSGLTFCRSEEVHHGFVRQMKRVMQWLMRIFFAASIGFQVPITHFGNGTVIWQGVLFTLALTGKVAVGFLVPNFNMMKRYRNLHLRDCLITGFSMAAEGEFAFVIAVFAVDQSLISQDLYASVVLAVLISTIIPPFLLRFTISYYNRKAEEAVQAAADLELGRRMDIEKGDMTEEEKEARLAEGILNQTTVFLCIQTQSDSAWGLLPRIMGTLGRLRLEVIDHRSWHPRGVDTTMVNEIFVKDTLQEPEEGHSQVDILENRMEEIREKLAEVINQPDSKVRVNRWLPGVLEQIVEEEVEKVQSKPDQRRLMLSKRIMREASSKLERDRELQMNFTKQRSVMELLGIDEEKIAGREGADGSGRKTAAGGGLAGVDEAGGGGAGAPGAAAAAAGPHKRKPRRMRQKMRSTPVIGGDLFGESRTPDYAPPPGAAEERGGGGLTGWARRPPGAGGGGPGSIGHACDLRVNGETFKIRIASSTLNRIRNGFSGDMVDDGSITVSSHDVPIERRLQGFVRNQDALARIAEETEMSEVSESVQDEMEVGGGGGMGMGMGGGGGGVAEAPFGNEPEPGAASPFGLGNAAGRDDTDAQSQ